LDHSLPMDRAQAQKLLDDPIARALWTTLYVQDQKPVAASGVDPSRPFYLFQVDTSQAAEKEALDLSTSPVLIQNVTQGDAAQWKADSSDDSANLPEHHWKKRGHERFVTIQLPTESGVASMTLFFKGAEPLSTRELIRAWSKASEGFAS